MIITQLRRRPRHILATASALVIGLALAATPGMVLAASGIDTAGGKGGNGGEGANGSAVGGAGGLGGGGGGGAGIAGATGGNGGLGGGGGGGAMTNAVGGDGGGDSTAGNNGASAGLGTGGSGGSGNGGGGGGGAGQTNNGANGGAGNGAGGDGGDSVDTTGFDNYGGGGGGGLGGGDGGSAPSYAGGGGGGAGVFLSSGTSGDTSLTSGITGGAGGASGAGPADSGGGGGGGGAAVVVGDAIAVTNATVLQGGAGGNGGSGSSVASGIVGDGGGGGGGGGGLFLFDGGSLDNLVGATILGGAGGAGGDNVISPGNGGTGGDGGAGFLANDGTLNNRGTIRGGAGGVGGTGGNGGTGGGGGVGIDAIGSAISNSGTISGGNGGNGGGGIGPSGGDAGAGISGSNLTITNDGTISGGRGGNRSNPFVGHTGIGGAGISGSNMTISNRGTIAGGNGGSGGVVSAGGDGISGDNLTITNSGAISGGFGGNAVTFTGGTNRLELQAGFAITGDVVAVSGGTDILAFGGAANSSFDLSLLGTQYLDFADLAKTGTGTWVLSGDGSGFTGTTTIDGGTLVVGDAGHAGTSLGGDATVNAAGTLAGHGTVTGNVDNSFGGIVAPGGSVGTLTVGGNYAQGGSSTLRIEVSPAAASQLAVGGTASLGGTLNLVFTPGVYSARSYTIVTATGGLGGSTFGTVTQNGGTIFNGITYDANNVMLGVNSGAVGGGFSVAPSNGQALGAASASMVLGAQAANRALFGHLNDQRLGVSDDNLRTAFAGSNPNQLAFAGDLAELNAILAELPQALAKNGGWFRATGGFGTIDAAGPNLDSYGGGFMAGYDRQVTDNVLLGAAVGFSRTQIDQGDSSASINTPRINFYGSYQYRQLAVDASIGYGFDRIKTKDHSAGGTAKAKHDAHEIVAALQAGYAIDLPASFVLTPRVGVDYLHIFEEGFSENGAGAFDLTTKSSDTDSLKPHIGLSLAKTFATDNGWYLTPQLHLTYSREMLDAAHDAQVVVGGGNFTVKGVKPSRDELALGTSLTAQLSETVDVYSGYTALLPIGNTVSHNFEAGLRVAF